MPEDYKTLHQMVGNTRVYLGDDSPTNVIAGVTETNPSGTKMVSTSEPLMARALNRAIGNVAASGDYSHWQLMQEVALPEMVELTDAATTHTLSGRYYVHNIPNAAAIGLRNYAAIVNQEGKLYYAGATLLESTLIEYNVPGGTWTRCDNTADNFAIIEPTTVTEITRSFITISAPAADVAKISEGDICVLTADTNDGTYMIDYVDTTNNRLYLISNDGSPIENGPTGRVGLDPNDMPSGCTIRGNGMFLPDCRVTFSTAIPSDADTYYLVIGKATTLPAAGGLFMGANSMYMGNGAMSLDEAYDAVSDVEGAGRHIAVDGGPVELYLGDIGSLSVWGDDNKRTGMTISGSPPYDGSNYGGEWKRTIFHNIIGTSNLSSFLMVRRGLTDVVGVFHLGVTLENDTITVPFGAKSSYWNDYTLTNTTDHIVPSIIEVVESGTPADLGTYLVTDVSSGVPNDVLTVSDIDGGAVDFGASHSGHALTSKPIFVVGEGIYSDSLITAQESNNDDYDFTKNLLRLISDCSNAFEITSVDTDSYPRFRVGRGTGQEVTDNYEQWKVNAYTSSEISFVETIFAKDRGYMGLFEGRYPIAGPNNGETLYVNHAGTIKTDGNIRVEPTGITDLSLSSWDLFTKGDFEWTDFHIELRPGGATPLDADNAGLYRIINVDSTGIRFAEIDDSPATDFTADQTVVFTILYRPVIIGDLSDANASLSESGNPAALRVRRVPHGAAFNEEGHAIDVECRSPGIDGSGIRLSMYGTSDHTASGLYIKNTCSGVSGDHIRAIQIDSDLSTDTYDSAYGINVESADSVVDFSYAAIRAEITGSDGVAYAAVDDGGNNFFFAKADATVDSDYAITGAQSLLTERITPFTERTEPYPIIELDTAYELSTGMVESGSSKVLETLAPLDSSETDRGYTHVSGLADTRFKKSWVSDITGFARNDSGYAETTRKLHESKCFPFWSGSAATGLLRAIPIPLENYYIIGGTTAWSYDDTDFALDQRHLEVDANNGDAEELTFQIPVTGGHLFHGVRMGLGCWSIGGAGTHGLFPAHIIRQVGPFSSEATTIKYVGQLQSSASSVPGVATTDYLDGGLGQPFTIPYTISDYAYVAENKTLPVPMSMPVFESDTGVYIPSWTPKLNISDVTEVGTSGGNYQYLVRMTRHADEVSRTLSSKQIIYHDPYDYGLDNLNVPFLGDYLWIDEGSNRGIYPITDATDISPGIIDVYISSSDSLTESPPNAKGCVPAIINPGCVMHLHMGAPLIALGSPPTSWVPQVTSSATFRIYQGIAMVESRNDIANGGFPFDISTTYWFDWP